MATTSLYERLGGEAAIMARSTVSAYTGANLDLRDAHVARVQPAACDRSVCPRATDGYGVVCVGGTIQMAAFSVRDATTCGVFVAPSASSSTQTSMDLQTGEISGSQIGACVQVDGYDTGRLSSDVAYRDNGTSLDATSLPVPVPADQIMP